MSSEERGDSESAFECELCDESFETEAELRDHVWEYHEMDGDVTP